MKKSIWSPALCGVVFAGLIMSGLVGPVDVQAMTITAPAMFGNCKGVNGTYTVKFKTGTGETSHTIRVEQVLTAGGVPAYMFLEQDTYPHPSATGDVPKEFAPTPPPNWSDSGHWMQISSSFVMGGNSFMGPTIFCKAN